MKKKLLYLTSIVLFSVTAINAQTTVWDFGNDTVSWSLSPVTEPKTSVFQTNTVVDNLGIFPGTSVTNFGEIDANNTTWGAPDGFTATKRLKFNGSGGINPAVDNVFMPTLRYLYFAVAGPVTVKIWYRLSGASDRTLYITDGSATVASALGDGSTDTKVLTANYTGGAGNLYVFGAGNSFNLYKMEVTGALGTTLSTKNFQKELDVTVYAKGGKINLSNIKSSTNVNVYSVSGALVKSAKVEGDTSLDINSGIYIVKAKSAEGEKSVKVLVK